MSILILHSKCRIFLLIFGCQALLCCIGILPKRNFRAILYRIITVVFLQKLVFDRCILYLNICILIICNRDNIHRACNLIAICKLTHIRNIPACSCLEGSIFNDLLLLLNLIIVIGKLVLVKQFIIIGIFLFRLDLFSCFRSTVRISQLIFSRLFQIQLLYRELLFLHLQLTFLHEQTPGFFQILFCLLCRFQIRSSYHLSSFHIISNVDKDFCHADLCRPEHRMFCWHDRSICDFQIAYISHRYFPVRFRSRYRFQQSWRICIFRSTGNQRDRAEYTHQKSQLSF